MKNALVDLHVHARREDEIGHIVHAVYRHGRPDPGDRYDFGI